MEDTSQTAAQNSLFLDVTQSLCEHLIPLHFSNPKGHCLQSLDLVKGIVGPEGSLAHCGPHSGASALSL